LALNIHIAKNFRDFQKKGNYCIAAATFAASLGAACAVNAGVISEGWYKVLMSGEHQGYMVERTNYDPSTKLYTVNTFLRTHPKSGNASESTSAVFHGAEKNFAPVSSKYIWLGGDSARTVEAKYNGRIVSAIINQHNNKKPLSFTKELQSDGRKSEDAKEKAQPDLILAAAVRMRIFLGPESLKSGIKVGQRFDFDAIAEEGAKSNGDSQGYYDTLNVYPYKVQIVDLANEGGFETFRFVTSYLGQESVSYYTLTGDLVRVSVPQKGIEIVRVDSEASAVYGLPKSEKSLKEQFGTVPVATPLRRLPTRQERPKLKNLEGEPNPNVPKGLSVPPGKGIEIQPNIEKEKGNKSGQESGAGDNKAKEVPKVKKDAE